MLKRSLLALSLLLPAACASNHHETAYERAHAECERQAKGNAAALSAGTGELASSANDTTRANSLQACLAGRGYISPQ